MSRERFLKPPSSGLGAEERLVEELEQELRQALTLEPSPDFARKVRARIDAQAPQRHWHAWGWAAAAACVLTLALGWQVADRSRHTPSAPPEFTVAADVPLHPGPAPAAHAERANPASTVVKAPTTSRARRVVQPEVLVPGTNARAVARLLVLARTGSLDQEQLTPVAAPASSATLDVLPLGVAPIPVPDMDIQNGPSFDGGRRQ